MRKLLLLASLFALYAALPTGAQETYFGKNKVRYKDFDWKFIQSKHFDVYFYDNAYPTAKFAAAVLESSYVEITSELQYHLQDSIPVFIYNSHNDFQQTNITSGLIPEGVGGFTEAFKKRIVIPFTGSYEDFRHVLHHELTHAVVYDLLFGKSLSSIISRNRLFDVPLWFAEGFAEYSSRHGWDYWADMVVRDATINNYLAPPDYIGGYLAYKQGQAMVKFIAEKYGEDKLGEILRKGKVHLTMNKALKEAVGIDQEKLWKEFSLEMKRRYWPDIADRKNVDEAGRQLTKARKDGSYFNEEPAYSPEGDKIAIFTDRSDYTEIILLAAADGRKLKTLVQAERSGDFESLHSYVSGMSWSPDGLKLVFVAKSSGNDALVIYNVRRGDIEQKRVLPYYNVVSPSWSPDGTKIAFAALKNDRRDLFVYDLETAEIAQLTDDRYDDNYPSWLPDSRQLIFSSDRAHPMTPDQSAGENPYAHPGALMPGDFAYGYYNTFRLNLADHSVEPVDVGPGQNKYPRVSPDGKRLAFISNRNGIDNIYVAILESGECYAVTDILTGVKSISWSPDGNKIAFSAFHQAAFDIFVLDNLQPAGDHGQLALTSYMKGEFDLFAQAEAKKAADSAAADSTTADSATPDSLAAETDTLLAAAPDSLTADSSGTVPPVPADIAATPASTDSSAATDSSITDTLPADTLPLTTDTLAIDTLPSAPDTAAVPADTAAVDTSGVIRQTGVYDGEYVFVSEPKTDPLDSLLMTVESDSVLARRSGSTESEIFDTRPTGPVEGEYEVRKYKTKFTSDFIGGGVAYDSFFGLRGQTYFIFSDYLGNHQFSVATDLVNSLDQSYIQAFYLNSTHRTNLGLGLFHTKNFYLDSRDFLFSDRFYGAQIFVSRPFSTFSRLQFGAAQYFIDREYHDWDDYRPNRSSKVTVGELAYITDNIVWGITGPVNGRRTRLSLEAGVNLFNSDDISFQAFGLDYRKYWHFNKTFVMAFRLAGGISSGATPKLYFLGGTTNWIGDRTLDARVYDVENLYFADVVTPLRGLEYYELSGNRYGLLNWEFRFPLIDYFVMRFPLGIALTQVQGAIFTDIGSAWTNSNFKGGTTADGKKRLNDIKTGFGFGMRANLGFILLRYDLAWNTDFYTVSSHPTSYFSFGADF